MPVAQAMGGFWPMLLLSAQNSFANPEAGIAPEGQRPLSISMGRTVPGDGVPSGVSLMSLGCGVLLQVHIRFTSQRQWSIPTICAPS